MTQSSKDQQTMSVQESSKKVVARKVNNYMEAPLQSQTPEPLVKPSKAFNPKFSSATSTPTKRNGKPEVIDRNVITKYAFATRVGYIPNNPNKVNQDSFVLAPNFAQTNYRHFFGVCDGHGTNGRDVSHFIKMRLPQLVAKHLISGTDPCQALHQSFIQCNAELDQCQFDVSLSGSTVCTVLFTGNKVICANAGDSRAIKAAIFDNGRRLEATALNIDHKPDLKDEAQRILSKGGRIDAFRDAYNNNEPIGPMRVWLKTDDLPGLAMSRSFGDRIA